ncbi:LPXTG cell wall anchor domain-containing protein [Kitasatospora sp. NPDC089797]|uniref:LPXTG cell wall anchor domain-containing protein n=1 Tax=Kitasatospora sp. NPDC089797 TaxID=3155298 RepID=UPI0034143382
MRVRRSGSTVLTAATLGVLLATGAVVASPAAYAAAPAAAATTAATADAPTLTVAPPTSFGNGGKPVEFTETVTNPGTADASYTLKLDAADGYARSTGRITVERQDAGAWKPVDLAFSQDNAGFHFTGEIPGVTVAAGGSTTVRLRIAAPLNNDWAGMSSTVKLDSAVVDPASKTVLTQNTKNISLKALDVQTKGAPSSAVPGGAPAEFDVVVTNSSASAYDNASTVVNVDGRSTLQVQKADGSWEAVTGVPSTQPGSPMVSYHLTADRTLAADSIVVKHVRLAFTAGAPLGRTYVNPWVVLGEDGGYPAYIGVQGFPVDLTAAPSLSVQEPASIGNGGKPVEFTETVTNPGTAAATYTLKLDVGNGYARSKDRITVERRDGDSWKPVDLAFSQDNTGFHFTGEIPGVTVAAGGSTTVPLRIAAPLNNDWAGMSSTVKLDSTVVDPASKTVLTQNTKSVPLKALDVQTKGAPSSAVIGGAPAEFDVTFTNSSASDYDNFSPVVQTDKRSVFQVQQADGSWATLTGTPVSQPGSPEVTYHLAADKNLAANTTVTKHVRLAFTLDAPLGRTSVNPAAILGEGGGYPAYVGPQGFAVDVTTAPLGTAGKGSATGGDTAVKAGFTTSDGGSNAAGTTGGTGGTDSSAGSTDTQLAGGALAHTGADGMLASAAAAAGLLASGIGAVLFGRRRRSA